MTYYERANLPDGTFMSGTAQEMHAGDYLCTVHGYLKVIKAHNGYLEFESGGSESGYPYVRGFLRPTLSDLAKASDTVNEYFAARPNPNKRTNKLSVDWTVVMEFDDLSVVSETDVKFYNIQAAIFRLRNNHSDKPAISRITIK